MLVPHQAQALMDLHTATNGAEWNHQWDLDDNPNRWHGVTVEGGLVTYGLGIEPIVALDVQPQLFPRTPCLL